MEDKKTEVISGIRSCLVSTQGKCTLRQISSDFWTLMGYKIPYVQLGHNSLEQFILSIPTLHTWRENGELLIDAKPSDKSSHIASMVRKQKSSAPKRKPSMPVRYFRPPQLNQQVTRTSISQWKPKDIQRNWKKTYQSSPRPAAVSHNQFVNYTPPPPPAQSRMSNRLVVFKEPEVDATPKNARTESSENCLSAKARKRITQRMAGISISNNGVDNGVGHAKGRAPGTLSPTEMQRLQQESMAAVDPKSKVWKWSSGDESSDNNISSPPPLRRKQGEVNFVATGDHLLDLFSFVQYHNLEEPCIKVTSRKAKLEKMVFYDCRIQVGHQSGSSYPIDCLDELSAKQAAAKDALNELLKVYNRRQSQSLLVSDAKDVLERMPPLVQKHYSGIWNTQLEEDYAELFNEQLPQNWLEIVDTIPCITVLPLLDKKFVLRFCKPGEKGNSFAAPIAAQVSVPSKTVKFNDDGFLTAEVTCVATAGEIWCRQIDTSEFESFTEMTSRMEQYYTMAQEKPEAVEIGGYYAARYDNYWCRVRVFEVNGDDVNCFYIDYGDEGIVSKAELHMLPRQFALASAQAFVCRLAGVEELYEASKTSAYLKSLVGKIVQVQMDSSSDDENTGSPVDPALSVVLYDSESEIVINEQLIKAMRIESIAPTLNKNSPTEVYVSQVLKDGTLYVQVHSSGFDQLNSTVQQLERNLVENKLGPPQQPVTFDNSKNRLYLAQYPDDGHWYRCQIVDWSPDHSHAQILFVDYGNTSIIKIKDTPLYPLDELSDVVDQFPVQAIRIRLKLSQVPKNFVERVTALMPPEQPVLVKVLSEDADKLPLVDIFKRSETDNVLFSVNQALAMESEFENAAGDGNNNSSSKLQSTKLQRLISLNKNVPSTGFLSCPPLPKVGNYFDVKVSFAVNPYNFFVQPYESQEKLMKLMAALQEKCNNGNHKPLSIEEVQPGKIYASKHENGMWYRTSVLKVIHQGSISAFYCDFGQYKNLNLKELVRLEQDFMELPYQAIKAKLAGIEPKHSKWSVADCEFFEKLVTGKPFVSILVAKDTDDLYRYDTLLILKLIDTSSDVDVHIDQQLVREGVAKLVEPR